MNIFKAELHKSLNGYSASLYGATLKIDGEKAELLAKNNVGDGTINLGVRPEHIVLKNEKGPDTIEGTVLVNEMMGSELHLHIMAEEGEQFIVRVPTIQLTHEERERLVYGAKVYVSFESKVMHFFDIETEKNLIY